MKFIHAVVFDKDEYESAKEWGTDFTDWGQVTEGDYVVHALYGTHNRDIIVLEDNCHQPVEAIIEGFLAGVAYANSTNIGGFIYCNDEPQVQKAYIVMDANESSYAKTEVLVHLLKNDYVEVND